MINEREASIRKQRSESCTNKGYLQKEAEIRLRKAESCTTEDKQKIINSDSAHSSDIENQKQTLKKGESGEKDQKTSPDGKEDVVTRGSLKGSKQSQKQNDYDYLTSPRFGLIPMFNLRKPKNVDQKQLLQQDHDIQKELMLSHNI